MASIKKNFIYTMLYEILIICLPIITSPYVSRVLGAKNIGIYSYTYSIVNYFVMFAMLGLANYGNRVIAQKRDNKKNLSETFCNLYVLHVVGTIIVLVGYVIYYAMAASDEKIFVLCQALYIIASMFNIDWFFFGLEQFKITVTRNSIIKVGTAICIFSLVKEKDDLLIYILILALGNLLGQISVWHWIRQYIYFIKPSWKQMKIHIKPLFVLFVPTIAVSLYKVMDKIMLGNMCDKVQVGFYENSEKIITIPMTVITAFGDVMKPRMTYLKIKELNRQAADYMKISMKYIQCLAYAFMFGIMAVASVFAPVFWGEEFHACGILISLLAVCIPFISFANVIRTQYLLPNSRDGLYNITLICGALANLIVNIICIPLFQAQGAVYGTIMAEVMVCILQVIAVKKILPVKEYIQSGGVYFIFGIIMYICVSWLKYQMTVSAFSLVIEISVGIFVYMILCILYAYKTKDEMFFNLVKKLLRRK